MDAMSGLAMLNPYILCAVLGCLAVAFFVFRYPTKPQSYQACLSEEDLCLELTNVLQGNCEQWKGYFNYLQGAKDVFDRQVRIHLPLRNDQKDLERLFSQVVYNHSNIKSMGKQHRTSLKKRVKAPTDEVSVERVYKDLFYRLDHEGKLSREVLGLLRCCIIMSAFFPLLLVDLKLRIISLQHLKIEMSAPKSDANMSLLEHRFCEHIEALHDLLLELRLSKPYYRTACRRECTETPSFLEDTVHKLLQHSQLNFFYYSGASQNVQLASKSLRQYFPVVEEAISREEEEYDRLCSNSKGLLRLDSDSTIDMPKNDRSNIERMRDAIYQALSLSADPIDRRQAHAFKEDTQYGDSVIDRMQRFLDREGIDNGIEGDEMPVLR